MTAVEEAAADRRRDIELTRRAQVACAWCGPVFVILLFGGWGLLGGLIPLIPPSASAQTVAADYARHADLHRFGLVLGMIGVFCTVPFYFAISMQMRRSEGRIPVLAYLQFAFGLMVCVVLAIPMLLFLGAAFRPAASPDLTRLVDDLSYLMLILPWPPILGQLAAIICQVLTDRRPAPVFPRWMAWFQLGDAILLLPATGIEFAKDGIFAWNGALGFWIPAAVFGAWYPIMTWKLLKAIRQEADEETAALAGRPG